MTLNRADFLPFPSSIHDYIDDILLVSQSPQPLYYSNSPQHPSPSTAFEGSPPFSSPENTHPLKSAYLR